MRGGRQLYKWLRAARIAVSLTVMIAVAAAVGAGYSIWLSRWQIIPALLAGAGGWLLLWAAATALAGRIYCSTACPLGTLQDIAAAVWRRRRGYFYSSPRTVVRRVFAVTALVAALIGLPVVVGLLDPAATFSRIVVFLGRPLAGAAAFSLGSGCLAAVSLAVTAGFGASRGRLLCNTVCPVGTLLGLLSRYSIYHVDINTDKCTGCGLCVARCKAECIDPSAHTVDASRCVVCFDCVASCPSDAITFRRGRHSLQLPMLQPVEAGAAACTRPDAAAGNVKPVDRRRFLAALLAVPAAVMAGEERGDYETLIPLNAVRPPGGAAPQAMARCTGCGLCVAACPQDIIRLAGPGAGLRVALHPYVDYDIGACAYDCVACTQVCPTGALIPLTPAEKHRTRMGSARVVASKCIEYADGVACGLCARRCPAGAIKMMRLEDGRRLPSVDFDACIGCGACRYVCPAEPRAIVIEGEL